MRTSTVAATAAAFTLGLGMLTAGTASADALTYGCQVSPGPAGTYTGNCHNSAKFHGPYSAGFLVQGASASATYSWNVPAGYTTAAGTCATTAGCRVDNLTGDDFVTVSVTVTDGGVSQTLSATAIITQVCGTVFC